MTVSELLGRLPFRPIRGCPGRHVLRGGPCTAPPQELTGGSEVPVPRSCPGARDPVVVLPLEDGGVISYLQGDGRYLHTLNDAEGFARKLQDLGIVLGPG